MRTVGKCESFTNWITRDASSSRSATVDWTHDTDRETAVIIIPEVRRCRPLLSPVSVRWLLRVSLRLLDQLFQRHVDGRRAGGAGPPVPDHAPGIDDVECRG